MSCASCKCDIAKEITLVLSDGTEVTPGYLCHICLDEALEVQQVMREDFDFLLSQGISRDICNDVMISRIMNGVY